jgi:ethanolamine utilization protein EutA
MDIKPGGRLFFTNSRRSLVDEDEIRLVSVGIDIGSSTTHLAFSRITLERVDSRYIVSAREVLFESEILLTPYAEGNTIDTQRLNVFFQGQYRAANIKFEEIDTGALILTGTAVRRKNARAIAELFAAAAGKFVSISAGDGMEAMLAAFGSGAVALSMKTGAHVLNIDIGGGTTKIARCSEGEIIDLTAIDIGARVLAMDEDGKLNRIEPAGQKFADECGVSIALGIPPGTAALEAIADKMAEHLLEAMCEVSLSEATKALLRLDPLKITAPPEIVTFSGGVSEYVYGRSDKNHGDLGVMLAGKVTGRIISWGPDIQKLPQGIRATVIGASQYTVQISGSTIFISEKDMLPLRNIPTILPKFVLEPEDVDEKVIAEAITSALATFKQMSDSPVIALCYTWNVSATYKKMDTFCRGVLLGFADQLSDNQPLVLIGDSDVGGLIGLHFAEELGIKNPIVSIDGIRLKEFDFIDIGAMLEGSGAVPVVIKSLVFPTTDAVGQPKIKSNWTKVE